MSLTALLSSKLLAKSAVIGAATGLFAAVVDDSTHVPIGVASTVGIFACGVVFWIGQRIQKLSDGLGDVKQCMSSLTDRLNSLPCAHPDCPANKKK